MKRFYVLMTVSVFTLITSCSEVPIPEYLSGNQELISPENQFKYSVEDIPVLLEDYLTQHERGTRNVNFNKYAISNVESLTIKQSSTRSSSGKQYPETLLYVVNLKNDGFCLVSADNRAMPILGYSPNGNLSLADTLSNVIAHYLITEARAVVQEGIDNMFEPSNTAATRALDKEVAPLIDVQWDQNYPFNKYSPAGTNYYKAGCVPIAMAQICSYYQKPIAWRGYSFVWADMLRVTDSSMSGMFLTGENMVARLIREIGLYAGTEYGVSSSGTSNENVSETFKNMGLPASSLTDFNQYKILTQLDLGRPVYGSGYHTQRGIFNNIYEDGHAWVYDGYQKYSYRTRRCIQAGRGGMECDWVTSYTYKFHYNFGWGTGYNGYYPYPEAGGYNFQYKKEIITI